MTPTNHKTENAKLKAITWWPFKVSSSLFLTVLLLYVALATAIAYKSNYVFYDPETKSLVRDPATDDQAIYATRFAVLDNIKFLKNQRWFSEISKNLSQEDMFETWGKRGVRVKTIFERDLWLGFSWMGIGATRITGTYEDATVLIYFLYPALLLLKSLFFLYIFAVRQKLYIALFLLVAIDITRPFSHDFWWYYASAYGYLFLSSGLALRLFLSNRIAVISISYILMLAAVFISMAAFPLVFLVAVVDFLRLTFPKYLNYVHRFIERYFLALCLGCFAAIGILGVLFLLLSTANNPGSVNQFFDYFAIDVVYLTLPVVMLYIAAEFMLPSNSGDPKIELARIWAAGLALGAVFLIAYAHLFSPIVSETTNRLAPYMYLVIVLSIGYVVLEYYGAKAPNWVRHSFTIFILCLLSLCFQAYSVTFNWKIDTVTKITEEMLPHKVVDKDKFVYYFASNPQHVYEYFMGNHFLEAPLILNVKTPRYSPAQVISRLKEGIGD